MHVRLSESGKTENFERIGEKSRISVTAVFSKLINGIPVTTMFSRFKSSPTVPHNSIESNPITLHFEIGKQSACAGPECIWKIHDAYRKSDGKECSVFLFEKKNAEKLHKPKRKGSVIELLKTSIKQLERFKHPKILQIIHPVEESAETLAFAAEPIIACLANVLTYQEAESNSSLVLNTQNTESQQSTTQSASNLQKGFFMKEYNFLDIEIKYGILQITEALSYLHYSGHVVHRNVCPSSILITNKGTWKLGGLEFIEKLNETDIGISIDCPPWSSRISKMMQPNLDYLAPEIQLHSTVSILSDMYSLGMVICAIFNNGRSLIQANNSTSNYLKQLEMLDTAVYNISTKIPIPLQEATTRLISKNPTQRPTAQLLQLIKYFNDSAVHALQFLDVINMKDPTQKTHFYRTTLRDVLPLIPRVILYK
ncbi:SCY1-like protein 2 [Condylostylus longicornis]|uniref:SCY1-like protein 2 n=1 Tax=Condylostylus longicornis TaxID=2530218 RepID=UPI00244E4D21|nr:SCY1-like protein 2 [Condylostylus longicornis]